MALAAGTKLGVYQVVAAIGRGGMGEVYRARDTKLHRDVALKVLPELFALDPDRLTRFEREAQLLASLNHPNIAAIHGFEDSNGVHALVLELVEGPTLAERITRGAIPMDEAAPITVTSSTLEPGTPVALFQTRIFGGGTDNGVGRQYDVAQDGRFLINTVLEDGDAPITLLQNWQPPAR